MSAATLIPTVTTSPLSPGKSGMAQASPQAVSASSDEIPALVIGDLHGHLDRFEALLKQEGLLDRCERCDGSGTYGDGYDQDCFDCNGDGWARTEKPAQVVLVGDIGHFGMTKLPDGRKVVASATADLLTWRAALHWADVILWGNHDRALVSERHAFTGYLKPSIEVYNLIDRARWEGKLKLAHSMHGFLITHAGLHLAFGDNKNVSDRVKQDPVEFAYWINAVEPESYGGTAEQIAVRDALSTKRGGKDPAGGILWRDIEEKLYSEFRQIFGHSADHRERAVRYCNQWGYSRQEQHIPDYARRSYCIDVGGPDEWPGGKCLAGIWLPSEEIVRVDL